MEKGIVSSVWHNLRTKPPFWEYVLVETTSKKMPIRVVYFTENRWWHSANSHCVSFQSCKKKPKYQKSDFIVKRWAYQDDVLKL